MERSLPLARTTPAAVHASGRGGRFRWTFIGLMLVYSLFPGWQNLYRRVSYGSKLAWQGQLLQLPLNWSVANWSASSQAGGTATLESYRWFSIPFVDNGPVSSNLTLFQPPANYTVERSLAYQGDLAQRNGYSEFIPTAGAGKYSCITRSVPIRGFIRQPFQAIDLQCFQREKGWSLIYFGSPAQTDQVFAMLAPAH